MEQSRRDHASCSPVRIVMTSRRCRGSAAPLGTELEGSAAQPHAPSERDHRHPAQLAVDLDRRHSIPRRGHRLGRCRHGRPAGRRHRLDAGPPAIAIVTPLRRAGSDGRARLVEVQDLSVQPAVLVEVAAGDLQASRIPNTAGLTGSNPAAVISRSAAAAATSSSVA
jgi:hypothetical protein